MYWLACLTCDPKIDGGRGVEGGEFNPARTNFLSLKEKNFIHVA